jgi:ATP-dependent helicase HrpB
LLGRIDDWLSPYLGSATRRRDVEALDVAMLLQGELGFDHFAELKQLAPVTLDVPGGRPIPIDYGDEPRISVRPQRLYGMQGHPSVLAGAVPLVVELLSPADRPIQVTTDLIGFWSGSWAQVRSEMAGRYPKHDWPVNPGEC